jgi:flagellar basal body-associated protein FliL
MADEEAKHEQSEEMPEPGGDRTTSKSAMFMWIIMAAIMLGCAVGGFALAQLVAGTKTPSAEPEQPKPQFQFDTTNGMPWTYELPAVIGNLDEPGVTRYVRITLTLMMSADMDETKGKEFLDAKSILLTDFVSDYIAGLSLERVRGQTNRRRAKKEITDGLNNLLFPNSKSYVSAILFKEFAVQ